MAAEETLGIRVQLKDFATTQLNKLNATVKGFGTGAVGAFKGVTGAVFSLKSALAGLGVALTVKGLTDLVKATANEADELRDLSKQLGTSTEFLSAFKFAAGQAGVEIGEVEVGLRTLRKNLGEIAVTGKGEAQEALNLLSRGFNDLVDDGASLEEIVRGLAKELNKLPETERVFAASKLFGRGGGSLLQLFAEDLEGAIAKAKELGIVVSGEAADAADKFNDSLGELSASLKGLRNQVILPLLPELSKLTQALTKELVENKPAVLGFFADVIEATGSLTKAFAEVGAVIQETIGSIDGFATQATRALLAAAPGAGLIAKESRKLADDILESANESGAALRRIGEGAETAASKVAQSIRDLGKVRKSEEISDEELLRRIADTGEATQSLTQDYDDQGTAIEGLIGSVKKLNTELSAKPLVPLLPSTDFDEILEDQRKLNLLLGEEAEARAAVGIQVQKNQQARREELNAIAGAGAAFKRLAEDSEKFGQAANEAILGVADSLSGNLTDGILAAAEGQKSLKEASRDAARSILSDIARIIVQTLILKAVQGSLGGLGGAIGFDKGGVFPGGLKPVRGLARGDVISPPGGVFQLAEKGRSEAVLPLVRGRNGDLGVQAQGGGQQAGGPPSITVIQNFNGLTIGEKALFERNKQEIEQAVAAKYASSATYRDQLRAA